MYVATQKMEKNTTRFLSAWIFEDIYGISLKIRAFRVTNDADFYRGSYIQTAT